MDIDTNNSVRMQSSITPLLKSFTLKTFNFHIKMFDGYYPDLTVSSTIFNSMSLLMKYKASLALGLYTSAF